MTGWIEQPTTTAWDGGTTSWDIATTWDYDPFALGLPIIDGVMLPANGAGDIYVAWDNVNAEGDWMLADGDLQTGQDLETACLVSLFTDKLATADFVPTDGTSDRRGWWADPYNDLSLGSNLWQLARAKKTRDTLGLAQRYASDALQWLVTDGVAKQVVVNTSWLGNVAGSNAIGIGIAIIKPDGSLDRFKFAWAWQSLAVLQSPMQVPPPTVYSLRRVGMR